ncbi:hypothetical protein PMAC_001474 [Pneumocystis sp. 'macacae']|nr:hypothetical protein PMAC_001474 [Pneumocystis sp. 'macacae']
MKSQNSKMPPEWAIPPHLITSSGLNISSDNPHSNLENTLLTNAPYENAQILEKSLETTLHSDSVLDSTFTSTLDTSIYPVPGLHLSLETPLFQTSIESQKAAMLGISTNVIMNAVNSYHQENTDTFLSENSKQMFEKVIQEKLKKTLDDTAHIKKINIETSTSQNNDTDANVSYPKCTNNELFQGNKKDSPFKFPGIAIPNLPFATIMDVQADQSVFEKMPVQNKPNIIKKSEIPIPKNEISIPKNEVSTPKNEIPIPKNEVSTPKNEIPIPKNEVSTPKNEVPIPKNETSALKNEISIPKNEPSILKNQHRSKNPYDVLLYELRKCFSVYAVTGDARNCVRTIYDLMKDIVEDKAKIVMLETLKGGIKDGIITAFIENKQVLGRIRNWLVNAINEKKNTIIIAILKIMSILKLDAPTLAELKMGKPIMILARKSENEIVKQLSMKWLEVAEKSLLLEKPAENLTTSNIPSVPTTEDALKKKQKINSNDSILKPTVASKSNSTKPIVKSQKVQPVVNTEFFKNLSTPTAKSSQKPSLSSVLAQIKAPKKSNTIQPQAIETTTRKFTSVLDEVPGYQTTSETTITDSAIIPDEAPKKKRKCVSWKSDNDLVEIRIFESLEPEETDNSFIHIFREFKNARDLDIYEGRAAFTKTHNIEDDMMTWREPEDIDFSHLDSELPKLGPKRGGINKCNSDECKIQEERERFVFLVSYLYEKDIPYSPTEPSPNSNGPFVETKTIPLPNDMKDLNTTDFMFQHNQGFMNNLAFSNTFNQNNIFLTNSPLTNNPQAKITSILQNLLNASGQATVNTSPIQTISQSVQHVTLPSSNLSSTNIANVSNILQMLQQSQKKTIQQSFPISSVLSGTSPFNFETLLGGGQQKNHFYTDRNERNDTQYPRDKRHRSQRHRRR